MKKSTTGFALIETIVAIVLLAGVLSAAVSLLVSAGHASDRNRDRMTATFLAQEGLELARNARDTAWKSHLPYDCAFNNPGNLCAGKIDVVPFSGAAIRISLPDAAGIPAPSKFYRTLTVAPSSNPTGVTVTAVVTFPTPGGADEVIKMSEILTNWRQK